MTHAQFNVLSFTKKLVESSNELLPLNYCLRQKSLYGVFANVTYIIFRLEAIATTKIKECLSNEFSFLNDTKTNFPPSS